MHCHFHNPVSIHSGPGMRRQIGALAAKYGKKALIVTTGSAHSRALAEEAGASLEAAGLGWAHYNGIRPNPLGSMAAEGAQTARDNGCDMVIGIGGGSVMDASKGIAFAYYNDAPIFEYIYGRKQGGQALPILLIATTAGTGSEGNWTAVFTGHGPCEKGIRPARPVSQGKHRRSGAHDHALQQGHRGARLRRAGPRHRVVPLRPRQSVQQAVFASGNPLAERRPAQGTGQPLRS